MEYIKFVYVDGYYRYQDSSSTEMDTLGLFLSSDVGCGPFSFQEWIFNDFEDYISGNLTQLEREEGHVFLIDIYPDEDGIRTKLQMKQEQFVHVLNEWQEKVCKLRPKEVIIKYENNQFVMETKD